MILHDQPVDGIDFEDDLIHVRGFKPGTERTITIEPNVRKILREAILGRKGNELVFRSILTGGQIVAIRGGLRKACTRADVKYIGVHGLRHTRGTKLAMRGMNAFQIAAEMGHANIATTAAYVQVNEAKQRGKRKDETSFHDLSTKQYGGR